MVSKTQKYNNRQSNVQESIQQESDNTRKETTKENQQEVCFFIECSTEERKVHRNGVQGE